MKDAKNTTSRSAITPRVRPLKRSVSDSARATSANTGMRWLRKSVTKALPATANRKHTATASTKAITWFLVMADMAEPIAR